MAQLSCFQKYYLFMICPVKGQVCNTNDGKGYHIQLPLNWGLEYGPSILFALQCCSLLTRAASIVGGVRVPDVFGSLKSVIEGFFNRNFIERIYE